jgi:hypothetical protein
VLRLYMGAFGNCLFCFNFLNTKHMKFHETHKNYTNMTAESFLYFSCYFVLKRLKQKRHLQTDRIRPNRLLSILNTKFHETHKNYTKRTTEIFFVFFVYFVYFVYFVLKRLKQNRQLLAKNIWDCVTVMHLCEKRCYAILRNTSSIS